MSDYRLIVKVKNNLLYQRMKEKGIATQGELARAISINPSAVGKVANLQVGAFNKDGTATMMAIRLCDFFGCLPEDIYPKEVMYEGLPKNVVEREVSSQEVTAYIAQAEADPAALLEDQIEGRFFEQVLSRLTEREQQVIRSRYFYEKTFDEIGKEIGVTNTRAQQLHNKCLAKLQNALKYEQEGEHPDATASGLLIRYLQAAKREQAAKDARAEGERRLREEKIRRGEIRV